MWLYIRQMTLGKRFHSKYCENTIGTPFQHVGLNLKKSPRGFVPLRIFIPYLPVLLCVHSCIPAWIALLDLEAIPSEFCTFHPVVDTTWIACSSCTKGPEKLIMQFGQPTWLILYYMEGKQCKTGFSLATMSPWKHSRVFGNFLEHLCCGTVHPLFSLQYQKKNGRIVFSFCVSLLHTISDLDFCF